MFKYPTGKVLGKYIWTLLFPNQLFFNQTCLSRLFALFHLLLATYFKVGNFKFFSVSNWLFVFLHCSIEFNLKDWDNEIRLVKTQPACYVAQNPWTCVIYFSRRTLRFFLSLMLVSCWSIQLSNFTGVLSLILSCKSIFTTWTILSIFGSSLKLFLFFFVDQLILYIYKPFGLNFFSSYGWGKNYDIWLLYFQLRNCIPSLLFRGRNLLFKVAQNRSSTFQDIDYYHSLSVDATIVVSKNCPIIGEPLVLFSWHNR